MKLIKKMIKLCAGLLFWIFVGIGLIFGGKYLQKTNPELGSALISFGILKISVITLFGIWKLIMWVVGNIIFGTEKAFIPKGFQWKIVSNTTIVLVIFGIVAFVGGLLVKIPPDDILFVESTTIYETLFKGDLNSYGLEKSNIFNLPSNIQDMTNYDANNEFFQRLSLYANVTMLGVISLFLSLPFMLYAFIIKWTHIKKLARIGVRTLELEKKNYHSIV